MEKIPDSRFRQGTGNREQGVVIKAAPHSQLPAPDIGQLGDNWNHESVIPNLLHIHILEKMSYAIENLKNLSLLHLNDNNVSRNHNGK